MVQQIIGYRKIYRLRNAVPGRKCIEVTFPYEVVEREARRNGLSVKEFISLFQVVAEYDGFEGVVYTFKRINKNDATS